MSNAVLCINDKGKKKTAKSKKKKKKKKNSKVKNTVILCTEL